MWAMLIGTSRRGGRFFGNTTNRILPNEGSRLQKRFL
jgi:hypothetical protein